MKKHLLRISEYYPHSLCCGDYTPHYRAHERVLVLGFFPLWKEVVKAHELDRPWYTSINAVREEILKAYGETEIEWSEESL